MSRFFHTASRTLPFLALLLAGAACLVEDGAGEAIDEGTGAIHLRAPLPVPTAVAPCIPGLPPSYPGCYPWPTPGGPPPPVACGPNCGR